MPSALETLVKILKLEQNTSYQNKAVIGGLQSFAAHWGSDAHEQAKKPEHHALIDELVSLLNAYGELSATTERHDAIRYMLGRITGRIPPSGAPPVTTATSAPVVERQPETRRSDLSPRPVDKFARKEQKDRSESRESKDARTPPKNTPKPTHGNRDPHSESAATVRDEPLTNIEAKSEIGGVIGIEITEQIRVQMSAQVSQEFILTPPENSALAEQRPGDLIPVEPEIIESPSLPRRAEPAYPTRRRRRGQRDPQAEVEAYRALKSSITLIEGVGPKMAEKLAPLDLNTVEDLLYFFPRRYDDYTQMLPLSKLRPGMKVTVIGEVRSATVIKGKRGQEILIVTIGDGTGTLSASFFGQSYLRSKFERGLQIVFSGQIDVYLSKLTMSHPEWELLEREALHTRAIVAVYPLTKGVTSHILRKIVRSALDRWASRLPDYMPDTVCERVDLPDLGWAIRQLHFPESLATLEQAQRRLAFDELIMLQLAVLQNRREWQSRPSETLTITDEWLNAFAATLPYALTRAQVRAIQAIREDLAHPVPMNRLLQGDVGAGKTVVAATAMAIAAANGYQAAIMAPTGILAEQHYKSISALLARTPGGEVINVKLLTSATSAQERADILWGLGNGSVHIIVGTHALLQDDVYFWRLGLAIIDEQHRFGVQQRGKLRGKGTNPHVLIMTATPIPRTLALTLYADLDLTVLDEMPPGRSPIETRILFKNERERAYSFVDSQIIKGRQAFIVYPLVEASDSEVLSEVRSAVDEFERLQKEIFPKYKLGLLHGRLSPTEKDAVMGAFSRNELQILVSTSVVEVGIDVPNATVMMIESANRFGLAQLHQFRGRVGRGQYPSYCLLIPDDNDQTNVRLQAMESTSDGFKLAEMDWEQRGAGELLGTQQSGGAARLGEHMDIRTVEEAQVEARTLFEEDPELVMPEHAALRERLRQRYGLRFDNADVS